MWEGIYNQRICNKFTAGRYHMEKLTGSMEALSAMQITADMEGLGNEWDWGA